MLPKYNHYRLFQVFGLDDLEARILSTIFQNPLTPLQVSEILDTDPVKIYRALDKLRKKGLAQGNLGLYSCSARMLQVAILKKRKELNNKKKVLDELESLINSLLPTEGDKNVR